MTFITKDSTLLCRTLAGARRLLRAIAAEESMNVKQWIVDGVIMAASLAKIKEIDPAYIVASEEENGSAKQRIGELKLTHKRKPRGKGKNNKKNNPE